MNNRNSYAIEELNRLSALEWKFQLLTIMPALDGSGAVEFKGDQYQAVDYQGFKVFDESRPFMVNTETVSFPTHTQVWEGIVGLAMSSGNITFYYPLNGGIDGEDILPVDFKQTVKFKAGQIRRSISS